jgi:hypothetical protein
VAHVARSIEVEGPVDTVHQEWLRFEELPRCAAHCLVTNVKWRAEVLTIEPIRTGTRITVKLEYEPFAGDSALACRLDAMLESFASFFEMRSERAAVAQPA